MSIFLIEFVYILWYAEMLRNIDRLLPDGDFLRKLYTFYSSLLTSPMLI